jgi:hypothetical protein
VLADAVKASDMYPVKPWNKRANARRPQFTERTSLSRVAPNARCVRTEAEPDVVAVRVLHEVLGEDREVNLELLLVVDVAQGGFSCPGLDQLLATELGAAADVAARIHEVLGRGRENRAGGDRLLDDSCELLELVRPGLEERGDISRAPPPATAVACPWRMLSFHQDLQEGEREALGVRVVLLLGDCQGRSTPPLGPKFGARGGS